MWPTFEWRIIYLEQNIMQLTCSPSAERWVNDIHPTLSQNVHLSNADAKVRCHQIKRMPPPPQKKKWDERTVNINYMVVFVDSVKAKHSKGSLHSYGDKFLSQCVININCLYF